MNTHTSVCLCQSALLEEQQSVMQHCAEERRKLAADWSRFHTQEKQRQERVEREASRAIERDANREGSIFSMAQVNTALPAHITVQAKIWIMLLQLILIMMNNTDIFKPIWA